MQSAIKSCRQRRSRCSRQSLTIQLTPLSDCSQLLSLSGIIMTGFTVCSCLSFAWWCRAWLMQIISWSRDRWLFRWAKIFFRHSDDFIILKISNFRTPRAYHRDLSFTTAPFRRCFLLFSCTSARLQRTKRSWSALAWRLSPSWRITWGTPTAEASGLLPPVALHRYLTSCTFHLF